MGDITASFERHRAEPKVTVDQYMRRLQLKLGESLATKKAIYLDMRFWIIARDVVLGRLIDPISTAILETLRNVVQNDLAFCPVSETTFLELLKQADESTRRATAALIDELSMGIALIPADVRLNTEVAHFLHTARSPGNVEPLEHLVWTKLAYVLGAAHPSHTPFDAAEERILQKAFVDHMWDVPLVGLVDQIAESDRPMSIDTEGIASRLNSGNAEHASELTSFQKTAEIEIHGAASLIGDVAARVLEKMYEDEFGTSPVKQEEDPHRAGRNVAALVGHGLCGGKGRDQLPSLYVGAMCHAAVRWNKRQKLDGNDLYDFHHASAALGYCDAFLTDGPMEALLTAKHIALDKEYKCNVLSAPEEALSYLTSCLA